MHCSGCVRKLENAFHKEDGMWATVSLERKEVLLRSKKELENRDMGRVVSSVGFTMLSAETVDL